MRKAWGKGKNEVLALKSDILELSAQGMNHSEIYRQLTSLGKLTVRRSTFYCYAKAICNQTPANASPPPPPPVAQEAPPPVSISPQPASSDSAVGSALQKYKAAVAHGKRRQFHFDPNQDISELMKPADSVDDDTDPA